MAFVTFAALIIHVAFPLAPPRWMPGFVDTMSEFGPGIYPRNALDGAANQIAAMPSLHFGWAMIAAIAVISVLKTQVAMVGDPAPVVDGDVDRGHRQPLVDRRRRRRRPDRRQRSPAGACSRLWIGERVWSWRAFRFKTRDAVAQLEEYANSTDRACRPSSTEGDALEAVD